MEPPSPAQTGDHEAKSIRPGRIRRAQGLETDGSLAPGGHQRRVGTVPGDPPVNANSSESASYKFGRKHNELRWRLELFPFARSRHPAEDENVRVARESIGQLRGMIEDADAARIERSILETVSGWREMTRTECYAECNNETIDRYLRLAADDDLEDDFDDVSRDGERIAGEIRGAVMEVLEDGGLRVQLLGFGETVDRAIHRAGVARRALRETPNWKYWQSKYYERRSSARLVSPRSRDEVEEEEEDEKPLTRRKQRPSKTTMRSEIPTLREVGFRPEIWSTDLRDCWGRLGMHGRLPRAVKVLVNRLQTSAIPALVRIIDELVRGTLSLPIDSAVTSRNLLADDARDLTVVAPSEPWADYPECRSEVRTPKLQGRGKNEIAITKIIDDHVKVRRYSCSGLTVSKSE